MSSKVLRRVAQFKFLVASLPNTVLQVSSWPPHRRRRRRLYLTIGGVKALDQRPPQRTLDDRKGHEYKGKAETSLTTLVWTIFRH